MGGRREERKGKKGAEKSCRRKRKERGTAGLMGGRWRKSPAVPLCCDNSVVSVPRDGWECNHYLFLCAGGHGRVFLTLVHALFFFFFILHSQASKT